MATAQSICIAAGPLEQANGLYRLQVHLQVPWRSAPSGVDGTANRNSRIIIILAVLILHTDDDVGCEIVVS